MHSDPDSKPRSMAAILVCNGGLSTTPLPQGHQHQPASRQATPIPPATNKQTTSYLPEHGNADDQSQSQSQIQGLCQMMVCLYLWHALQESCLLNSGHGRECTNHMHQICLIESRQDPCFVWPVSCGLACPPCIWSLQQGTVNLHPDQSNLLPSCKAFHIPLTFSGHKQHAAKVRQAKGQKKHQSMLLRVVLQSKPDRL